MTLPVNNRNDYVGAGNTATYSFNFKIFDDDDLLVTQRNTSDVETTLVKTTDYSVIGVGLAAGGSITLTAGNLPSGYTLTIRRVVPLLQATDLRNQESFFAEVHEDTFDYLMMGIQQLNDGLGRAIRLPETVSPDDVDTLLPVPAAGMLLQWNPEGTALINVGAPSGVTLVEGAISGGAVNRVPRFSSSTVLTSSSIFDDGTSTTIGTNIASDDPTQIRLQIQKDFNGSANLLVRNNTSGTIARAAISVKSGGASKDITLGVTSAGYTPAGGISANAGFLYTGVDATAGLTIQTGAGSIYFQPSGTTVRLEVSPTALTVTGNFAMSGIVTSALVQQIDQNNSTDLQVKNAIPGTSARASLKATSDTGTIYVGVTSSTYTFIGSAQANQGFVATTDATTVNGIVFKSVAGPFLFRPGHGVVAAPTNALLTLTADYAVELTDTSTAAVGAAGTIRLRNNAGTLEISQNGGAYAAFSGGGGGGIGGSGTAGQVAMFTAGTTLGNSSIWDGGTSTTIGTNAASDDPTTIRFQVQADRNQSTNVLIRNNTSGTLARTALVVRSGSASNDMSFGVTSAGYTPAGGISASAGFIYTGAGATAGMTIQTAAGSVYFQPAGTTVRAEIHAAGMTVTGALTTSGAVTVGSTLSIAGNIVTSPVTLRFDQNDVTYMLVQNATSGTIASSRYVARSGSASLDISIGVTSAGFTPANGISASAGLIYTGVDATAGLAIQTGAGSIYFQPAGTVVRGEFSSAGLGVTGVLNVSGIVTAASFVGVGASLTSLNAANLTGVVAVANGGTGSSSFTSGRVPYYNGATLTNSRLSDNGTDLNVLTGSINVNTSAQGIRFASTGAGTGCGIDGNSGGMNFWIGAVAVAAFDNTNSSTGTNLYVYHNGSRKQVLNGATDSGGAGFRLLRVNN